MITDDAHATDTTTVAEYNAPERNVTEAKPITEIKNLPDAPLARSKRLIHLAEQDIQSNKMLAEQLLNQTIERGNPDAIENVLKIYRTFAETDPLLIAFAEAQIAKKRSDWETAIVKYREILAERPDLTPVRIQLAIALFYEQQDSAAKEQFDKAATDKTIPPDISHLVQQYLEALAQRDTWRLNLSSNYLRDENVNNVSAERYIEGTAFRKNDVMLPKSAHGIGYYFNLARDFNLYGAHYLHIENELRGKNYWDAHDYDDILNRTYLGYTHKSAVQTWSVLPFYEREWYGNHRYKWMSGVRGEFNRRLNENWQISTALEFGKERYHGGNALLNGTIKLASLTLLWRPVPHRYFFGGIDFTRDSSVTKRYSYDLKTVRIGWGEEWNWGISTRLSFSASKRDYKDNLVLGSVFYFSKAREDEIYHINATVWKRDWHLWGITPKLNYHWRKQHSNFDSLYSYSDKNVNLLFEKTF